MTTNRSLRVFLCHSSNDKLAVHELYQKLRAEAWIQAWLDEEKLLPGQAWEIEIEKAVASSDVVLVCLSNNSINKRGYVQKELRFALNIALEIPEEEIFIIPLRLEECTPPSRLRALHYADYFPESERERAFQKLLDSLKRRADSQVLKYETTVNEPVISTLEGEREISQNKYIIQNLEQSLDSPIEFQVETPENEQIVRDEDCPLSASGTYFSEKKFHAWVILDDKRGNFYLQNPPIQFPSPNLWKATNICPADPEIEHIHFVYVDEQGNLQFLTMARHSHFGAFHELPPNSKILCTINIKRVTN